MTSQFIVGELYSHEEAYRSLGVGNAGGVRFLLNPDGSTKRAVLFTAVPESKCQSENPYHDRIENDVLIYTAQGRRGEQGFGGQNQRLMYHGTERYPIYCFQLICSRRNRNIGIKRWRFLGFLFGLRRYKEPQIDTTGTIRVACIFEFAVLSNFRSVIVTQESEVAKILYADYEQQFGKSFSEDEENVNHEPPNDSLGYSPEELETTRSTMLALHPQRFETLIRDVLIQTGYRNVCVTQYSQDGGIDVDAIVGDMDWPLKGVRVQIQAKRWLHTVGRKEVAELRGSLAQYSRGAIVTTSQFSKAALMEACQPGKLPIAMIDGYDFAKIVKRHGVSLAS